MSDFKPCPNKGSPCFCTGICKEPIGYERESIGYYTRLSDTRTDERAEMQAAIVELRSELQRLLPIMKRNMIHRFKTNEVLNNTKKWSEL